MAACQRTEKESDGETETERPTNKDGLTSAEKRTKKLSGKEEKEFCHNAATAHKLHLKQGTVTQVSDTTSRCLQNKISVLEGATKKTVAFTLIKNEKNSYKILN